MIDPKKVPNDRVLGEILESLTIKIGQLDRILVMR
jgi:hypothetical protein